LQAHPSTYKNLRMSDTLKDASKGGSMIVFICVWPPTIFASKCDSSICATYHLCKQAWNMAICHLSSVTFASKDDSVTMHGCVNASRCDSVTMWLKHITTHYALCIHAWTPGYLPPTIYTNTHHHTLPTTCARTHDIMVYRHITLSPKHLRMWASVSTCKY